MEKRIDAALAQAFAAKRGDERARSVRDPVAHVGRDLGSCEDAGDRLALVDPATDPDSVERDLTGPRRRILDRLEKTGIGTRKAGGFTSVRRGEQAGCLLYGPYWQLPSGAYRLDFRCRAGKPRMPGHPV